MLRSLGPAFIVAAVVLGPGSILSSSKVGAQFGYSMLWVIALAAILMVAMVALSGRLGLSLRETPCRELERRLGPAVAWAIGIIVFLIVACFQSSNNLAVLTAIEGLFPDGTANPLLSAALLVALNIVIVAFLLISGRIYGPIEKLLLALVGIMILGFLANLAFTRPSLTETLSGFLPSLPEVDGFFAREESGSIVDPLWPVQALFGTTLSVAAAFYQAYLVRAKGWGVEDLKRGLLDSVFGIAVLAGLTATILVTAASAFHGRLDPASLESASDVARQLEPTFGGHASLLFAVGIFAAAFSSFLVNAMVGGQVLADGIGVDASIDSRATKGWTIAALLLGMLVALWTQLSETGRANHVQLILIAQGLTLLGIPALAAVMLYLGICSRREGSLPTRRWMLIAAGITLMISIVLAVRTGRTIWLKVMLG